VLSNLATVEYTNRERQYKICNNHLAPEPYKVRCPTVCLCFL